MSICPTCGHRNPEDAPLCEMCGATLAPSTSLGPAPEPAPLDEALDLDDPLAGLEGLLPAPPSADPGLVAGLRATRTPDEDELREAELLRRIAAEAAPLGRPRRGVEERRPEHPTAGLRRFLYLLVALAALAPFFTGDLTRSWVRPRPQVLALAEELGRIPAEGRALVAFDYAPGYSGELDPLAERVLADLARRGVPLVALSTRPEGVGLARRVLGRAAAGAPDYRYGANYAILGYLPGEEQGLRLLAQGLAAILPHDDVLQLPLARLPALQGVAGLDDFQAVILLTDDANGARRWIEQVGGQTRTPTYALATARIEPLLAPYLASGQLAALVGGAYGALEYPLADAPLPAGLRGGDGYLALWGVFVLTALAANLGRKRRAKGA